MIGHNEIWWSRVPGCSRLIQSITDHLAGGKTVWFCEKGLAWPEVFRNVLKESMYISSSGVSFSTLDASVLPSEEAPVEAIRQHVCGSDAAPSFFKDSMEGLVRSLPELNIAIWLYNIPKECLTQWLELSAALAVRKGVRLTVACETPDPQMTKRNIISVAPEAATWPLDMQYFAMTLLSRQSSMPLLTEYACGLIAEIAQKDASLCGELCLYAREVLRSPYETCRALIDGYDENHIRVSLRNSQIKYILPLIEKKRLAFIERLASRAERLLPFSDDFDNQINTPPEIELRHLVYFFRQGMLPLSDKEAAFLKRLHDARNQLSHLQVIPYEQVVCIQEHPLL